MLAMNGSGHYYYTVENDIDNFESISKIHSLFSKNIHFEPFNSAEFYYYGIFYGNVEKDYDPKGLV